jgi:hypothetical protein
LMSRTILLDGGREWSGHEMDVGWIEEVRGHVGRDGEVGW